MVGFLSLILQWKKKKKKKKKQEKGKSNLLSHSFHEPKCFIHIFTPLFVIYTPYMTCQKNDIL